MLKLKYKFPIRRKAKMKKIISLIMCVAMLLTSTNVFAKMIGYHPANDSETTYYFECYTEPVEVDGKVYYTVSNTKKTMSGAEYGYLKDMLCPAETVITVMEPMEYFEVIYHEITAEEDVSYRMFPDGSVVTGEENVMNIQPGTTYTLNWEGVYEIYRGGKLESFICVVSANDSELGRIADEATVNANPNLYIAVSDEASVIANPTDSEIVIGKGAWMLDAYNINDNNYFKLRDIAFAFTYEGEKRPFEVTWDGEKNAINLISNKEYTAVGGECGGYDVATGEWPEPDWDAIMNGTVNVKPPKEAKPTTSEIYIDGVKVNLTAYNIDDNNYFKLRDLAEALDFEVIWNGEENRIYVSTYGSYIPE